MDTTKELWDLIERVYRNFNNVSRIYEIKNEIIRLSHEGPFVEYLGKLQGLWSELETLRPPTSDLTTLARRHDQDKSFSLLANLKPSYSHLVQHILRFHDMPSFNEVCMMV